MNKINIFDWVWLDLPQTKSPLSRRSLINFFNMLRNLSLFINITKYYFSITVTETLGPIEGAKCAPLTA
jgi:hypothetical protein